MTCSAWLKYGELAEALAAHGVALHNLASLPHISIAGAIATATHGSGDANGNLATAVRAVELVTSDGEVLTVARGEPDFDGLVVGLGALGVVTRVTLDVEPAYEVRQRVFEGLSWDALHEHFDEITASGYSVSVFTRWGETVDQVWIKSRVTDAPEQERDELFGAVAATVDRHPILGLDPVNCTPQLGVPGRGRIACRTSAWASPPATARRSSPSSTWRATTPRARSAPSTRWPRRCAPCCRSRRSAPSPPTSCG